MAVVHISKGQSDVKQPVQHSTLLIILMGAWESPAAPSRGETQEERERNRGKEVGSEGEMRGRRGGGGGGGGEREGEKEG